MSPLAIINKYYPDDTPLRRLLLHHSWQVTDLAMRCANAHPEQGLDTGLVLAGGLLHDIGIFLCHAPKIYCTGTNHYLLHGFLGGQLMRQEGLEAIARICERHTGAGLKKDALLPLGLKMLPHDYLPETKEEQLICYADKFYSKSRPEQTLTFDQAFQGLLRFGEDGAERFRQWHKMFAISD